MADGGLSHTKLRIKIGFRQIACKVNVPKIVSFAEGEVDHGWTLRHAYTAEELLHLLKGFHYSDQYSSYGHPDALQISLVFATQK